MKRDSFAKLSTAVQTESLSPGKQLFPSVDTSEPGEGDRSVSDEGMGLWQQHWQKDS